MLTTSPSLTSTSELARRRGRLLALTRSVAAPRLHLCRTGPFPAGNSHTGGSALHGQFGSGVELEHQGRDLGSHGRNSLRPYTSGYTVGSWSVMALSDFLRRVRNPTRSRATPVILAPDCSNPSASTSLRTFLLFPPLPRALFSLVFPKGLHHAFPRELPLRLAGLVFTRGISRGRRRLPFVA